MSELGAWVKIAANGRMVLPQAIRAALGLHGEGRLIASIQDGEVRLATAASITEKVQRLYRENVLHDSSTDDFLAERRREAAGEQR